MSIRQAERQGRATAAPIPASAWANYGSAGAANNARPAGQAANDVWAQYGGGNVSGQAFRNSPQQAGANQRTKLGTGTFVWGGSGATDQATTPNNINPFGGVRDNSGGGGGGGEAAPDYSAWGGWAAQAQPGMYDYTPLDLPDYNAPEFYDFDPGQFDVARQGVQTGIADARARGNTAFDRSAQSYMNYEDPFAAGPRTSNPGIDPRLMASMEAWGGAGSSQAAQTFGEGVQADDAMGSVYDLLSKVGAQFNQGQLAGVEGDRMQMDQRLGGEERMLTLGVDMALARAKSQYQQDLFAYGKAEADKRYEIAVQEALANNQGTNNANQMNTQTTNNWNQGIIDSILTMIGNGGTGIPQAGNDLSKLITMPRRVA